MFCHFWQKFENSKWPPFLRRGKFFENCRVHSLDTLWVENFDEIALSRTVKEKKQICVLPFLGKIGQGLLLTGDPHVMVVPPKYFFHAINVQQLIYVLYNFDEIALSRTVKEIQAILCFAIFGKNRPRPAAYWRPACYGCATQILFSCYKCAAINICFIQFRRNRSISHG